jgi:hypothetical protein
LKQIRLKTIEKGIVNRSIAQRLKDNDSNNRKIEGGAGGGGYVSTKGKVGWLCASRYPRNHNKYKKNDVSEENTCQRPSNPAKVTSLGK